MVKTNNLNKKSLKLWLISLLFLLGIAPSIAQTTYYSRNSAPQPQDWDLASSWTVSPDGNGIAAGPPQRNDIAIILDTHTIIIDSEDDNGSPGVSPTSLNPPQTNIGPFNGSTIPTFYHTGNIIINEGGTLETQSTTKLMIAGTTYIFGDLVVTGDIINLGEMFMSSTAGLTSTDDLILSGFSTTRIDNTAAFTNDDLYIDHTDALLCGIGVLKVGEDPDPNPAEVQFFNLSTAAQICSAFTIIGCDVSCPTGTGTFTLSSPDPILSGTGSTLNYIENSVVPVDPGITLTYAEPFLLIATVSITNNFVAGEDVLAMISTPGIFAFYNSTTGVLFLFGFADPATWQIALRNITYENLSDNPTTTTRTVSFIITNILATSNTFTRDIAITAVNDPPDVSTVSGSPTPLAYTEGDGVVTLDNQIEVDDVDDVDLEGATISLTNYVPGEDFLDFADNFGVSKVDFNTTTGILSLIGTATLANYELALRSVTYENTSEDPDPTTRTANFVVNDGDADSPPFSRDIEITSINDAPVITGTLTALAYTEGDGAVLLDDGILVSDVDNTNLASATISITANYQVSEDFLAFVDQNGIVGNFVAGVLTLTGSASLADYQTALRSITYENISEDPNSATRTVSFIINDGSLNSSPFTRDILITPVFDLPVISGTLTALAYTEGDGAVLLDDGILVSDVDNSNLASATISFTANYQVSEDFLAFVDQNGIVGNFVAGVLTLTGSASLADYQTALRSISYENISEDPNSATRTVSFIINDGSLNSSPFTRDILITPVFDLPVISGTLTALAYTEGDGAVLLDDGILVSDVDNSNLASATISFTANYQVSEDFLAFVDQNGIVGNFAASVLTLTGSASLADYQTALRSITYENISEDPNSATRTVSFVINDGSLDSSPFTRDILITPVLDLPVISGTLTALAYTEGDGAVLLDDGILVSDVDNTNLASATISFTANYQVSEDFLAFVDQNGIVGNFAASVLTLTGSASLADYQTALRSITYENISEDPSSATRTVSFVINDGSLDSSPFTRDILITPVLDLPVISGTLTALAYTEGDGAVLLDDGILVSDVDNTNLASATISFTANYQVSEDFLAFVDQNGIVSNFAAGVLTLTGSASLADYQTALRSITYENISTAPSTAQRIVEFIVNDGSISSIAFNRDIIITSIIEAPVISASGGGAIISLTYTEGDGKVVLDAGFDVNDNDDSNLEGTTLFISNNYALNEDVLGFIDQAGIAGSFNSSTGILTLSGTASILEYQTALRTITYENTSENPSNLTRSILLEVSDGEANSNSITISIDVIPVNDAPLITGTSTDLVYLESSGPVAIDDLVIPSDVDNQNLVSAIVRISSNYQINEDVLSFSNQSGISAQFDINTGTLSLTGTASITDYEVALRSITYENLNDRATLSPRIVEFMINDGSLESTPFLRNIIIEEVADPVIVYQLVTPDGDSLNDTWVIDGIEQFPNNTVSLFNRWNSLVYKQETYDNNFTSWNGIANEGFGKGELPDGTYFYTVNLGDGSNLLEGFLVLKRK